MEKIKKRRKTVRAALLFHALLFICLLPITHSYGFEFMGQECSLCHMLTKNEAKDLLKDIIPDPDILDIRLSSAKGFWEVYLESKGGKGLVYVDFLKRYLFLGSLISIGDRKNLTQKSLTELSKVNASQIPLEDALVMGDPKARIQVIVFTNID